MFASLSSFFPATLASGARPPDILSPPPEEEEREESVPDPPRRKENLKREKHPNEVFIIVRPPPSKSAQPLSLQVQLVPPQSRNDRPVAALDSSPDDLGTDLKRTHSNGSEGSAYSGYTSATSVSSFSSTASSGRRMIIPLYNLNVHSMMPTTILDAGTDAKVAKFAKRGLEVIGLAFLEPIEVRPGYGSLAASSSARPSLDDSIREFVSPAGTFSPGCPASPSPPNTAQPVHARGDRLHRQPINLPLAAPLPPTDIQPPQRSAKKLFTKMFKKKDAGPQLSVAVPDPDETSPSRPTFQTNIRLPDEALALSPKDTSHPHDARSCTPLANTITSQTAVLGVHPTLYPPVSNPRGRPTKYIWVVRKWLKGSDTGILNGMMGKLSVGTREAGVPDAPRIEVRFEWSRDSKKEGSRSRTAKSSNPQETNPSPSRRRLQSNTLPHPIPQTLSPDPRDHRSSVFSNNSTGSDTAGSLASSTHRHVEESSEDSDPEDSETPWTCTVTVQRLGPLPQHHHNGTRELNVRLKAATLAPTPHHPKVVGLLRMPFPLPDIEVEHLLIRRRLVTAQGISKTTALNTGEFILTAEEIKDTVSSTALWLVVREAFGGVGRERKKGKS